MRISNILILFVTVGVVGGLVGLSLSTVTVIVAAVVIVATAVKVTDMVVPQG